MIFAFREKSLILFLFLCFISIRLLKCSKEEPKDIASPTATKNTVTSPPPQRISGVLNCFLEKSKDQEALVLKSDRIFSEILDRRKSPKLKNEKMRLHKKT